MEHGDKSLKAQMKRANRLDAGHVLIVGENELAAGKAVLRDMATKEQTELPIDGIVDALRQRLAP